MTQSGHDSMTMAIKVLQDLIADHDRNMAVATKALQEQYAIMALVMESVIAHPENTRYSDRLTLEWQQVQRRVTYLQRAGQARADLQRGLDVLTGAPTETETETV